MARYKGNRCAEYVEENKYEDKTIWALVNRKYIKILAIIVILIAILFTALVIRAAHAAEVPKGALAEMLEISIVLRPWNDTQVIFADRSFPLTPYGGFVVFIGRHIPGTGLMFHGEVIKDK